jgi:hypothetical protein
MTFRPYKNVLQPSTVEKLSRVSDNTLIGTAIRIGIEKNPAETIKMIKHQIADNKKLMTEVIGEDLVNEVSVILFV